MKRKRLILVLAVLGLGVAAWAGARVLIRSRIQLALQTLSGGDIEIGDINVGWSNSTITDLRWRDADVPEQQWLTVNRAEMDLGVWPVLCGARMPKQVRLTQPRVDLKLDANGRPLTNITLVSSGAAVELPRFDVQSGSLLLTQGQRQIQVKQISGVVTSVGDRSKIVGQLVDSDLGKWSIAADFERTSGAGSVSVKTDDSQLDSEQLKRLPFIHAYMPKVADFDGRVAGEINLKFVADQPVNTNAKFAVDEATVHWNSAPQGPVDVTNLSATIDIADKRVVIHQSKANVLGAAIEVDGVISRSGTEASKVHLVARNLDVAKLPKIGRLAEVGGTVDFDANVELLNETTAKGTAVIEGAWRDLTVGQHTIKRIPISWDGTFEVASQADVRVDGELRIDSLALTKFAIRDLVIPLRMANNVVTSKDAAGRVVSGEDPAVEIGRFKLSAELDAAVSRQLTLQVDVADAEVSRVAKVLGVSANVPSGSLESSLSGRVALNEVNKIGAWQLSGSVASEQLAHRNVDLSEVSASVVLRDGKLWLSDGELTVGREAKSTFSGSANFMDQRLPCDVLFDVGDLEIKHIAGLFPSAVQEHHDLVGKIERSQSRVKFAFRPFTWNAAGKMQNGEFTKGDFAITQVNNSWTADAGQLRFIDLKLHAADGVIEGQAVLPLAIESTEQSELTFRDINLNKIAGLWKTLPVGATGVASGTINIKATRTADSNYSLNGKLAASSPLTEIVRREPDAQTDSDAPDLRGAGLQPAKTTGKPAGYKPAPRQESTLVGPVDSKTQPSALFSGKVDEFAADLTWKSGSPELKMMGNAKASSITQPFQTSSGQTSWRLDEDGLHVYDFKSGADSETQLGGEILIPLRDESVGKSKLSFQKLDVTSFVPADTQLPVTFDSPLEGTLSADIGAVMNQSRRISGAAKFTDAKVRVAEVPLEVTSADFDVQDNQLKLSGAGQLLGGRLKVATALSSVQRDKFNPRDVDVVDASLELREAALADAAVFLGVQRAGPRLRGKFDIDLQASRQPTGELQSSGEVRIPEATWNDSEVLRQLVATLAWKDDLITLTKLQATVGGGALTGHASLRPHPPFGAEIHFGLVGADLTRVLAAWPELSKRADGTVSLNVNGNVGHVGNGTGQVLLTRAKLAAMNVVRADLPLVWSIDESSKSGSVRIRRGSLDLDRGRATASIRFDYGSRKQLSGTIQLIAVNVQDVLRSSGRKADTATGIMSGKIEFSTRDPSSLQDLTAKVTASVDWKKQPQLALLRRILSSVVGQSKSSAVLQHGELQARIERGTVKVDRLVLTGKRLQVVVTGTVTMQGRLDLRVVADTGQVARMLDLGLLSTNASSKQKETYGLLATQLVQLHVTGTVSSPVIRAAPLPQLTPAILQSFVPTSR